MAKKKKSQISKYLGFAALVFSLLAVVMIFLPAIGVKDRDDTFSGLQVAFGYKKTAKFFGQEITSTYFNFSFMNLLTYLLPLAAFVLLALSAFGKKQNKLFVFIAAACLIVSAVFFFMNLNFVSFNEDVKGVYEFLVGDIKDGFELAIGSILGGVCGVLGGASALGAVFIKK